MTSNYELETLAKLVHEDTIAKAQMRRFVRSVKKPDHGTSEHRNRSARKDNETTSLLKKQCVVLEGGSHGR